ncbi:MAG: hypothetical protein SOZ23_03920 [Methanosphaera sp.]|uniref:hypothetical protein n=1 Tax=Methanosphaera sp. TaxID=2666342 RepID=UPI0025E860F7|nr:hypothetical protein [Methanosphaera sp.]MCI5866627.1 hypothetical protein [Methanosphaera sp.]MDD6535111.1 hypothetical protein [Methanosphaera sp.]MDY3955921.1 hypothetical protein [Methanosphaera sp.]
MANEVERLEKRMVELNNDLQNKKTNPDFAFENIKSVDMLLKIIINLNKYDDVEDGIYLYIDDSGIINAEYFIKEDGEVTIVSFNEEQLALVVELYSDVFAVNVE